MPAQPFVVYVLTCILLVGPLAKAEDKEPELVSSMGLMMAEKEQGGYTIIPATDIPLSGYTEDHAPPQVFEIVRPGMGPLTVGRLVSSCGCLLVTMEKKNFAQGERAVILVRNIKPTVEGGATYAFFVQIEQPVKQALQYDIFVKSGPWPSEDLAAGAHNPLRSRPRPTPPSIEPPRINPPDPVAPTPDRPHIERPVPDRPTISPPTTTRPSLPTPRADPPEFARPTPGRNTADGPAGR